MTQWILDTDHVSAILRGNRSALKQAAVHYPNAYITIVTVQELFNGWNGKLNQTNNSAELVRLYKKLADTVAFIKRVEVLDFDTSAEQIYASLRQQPQLSKKRVDKDLRIASIALSQSAVMVTRNYRDFSLIPNLNLQNWIE